MVHDGPVRESLLVTQVAQVVAVAPHLQTHHSSLCVSLSTACAAHEMLAGKDCNHEQHASPRQCGSSSRAASMHILARLVRQLGVADRRRGRVLVHRVRVLREPAREVAEVPQHLHVKHVANIVLVAETNPPILPGGLTRTFCRTTHAASCRRQSCVLEVYAARKHCSFEGPVLRMCRASSVICQRWRACGTSRWPRMRCVQTSSGVSLSPAMAAAQAPGPLVCSTYSRLSGRRPPRKLRWARVYPAAPTPLLCCARCATCQ